MREQGNVRLRKIDIDEWSSPVAQQYDIRSIPHLRLYEGRKLVTKDTQEIMRHLTTQQ